MSIAQSSIRNIKPRIILIENAFERIMSKYEGEEFIPLSIIKELLNSTFGSNEIIHQYSDKHFVVKIKIIDLLNGPIKNWEYNRPPDMIRCINIAKYIYNSNKPLDTMMHLSFNIKTKSFDMLDGIHRFNALKIIYENNSKPLDLLSPSDFGNNLSANWLYDSYVILNIRFNSTQGENIEVFQSLNKSSPVPELYIRDYEKERRETIESIANDWQIKYNSHFVATQKPNRPNINRDRFVELLDFLYEKHNIVEGKKVLSHLVETANWNITTNPPKKSALKITLSMIEKCQKTGCWLFIYPIEQPEKII